MAVQQDRRHAGAWRLRRREAAGLHLALQELLQRRRRARDLPRRLAICDQVRQVVAQRGRAAGLQRDHGDAAAGELAEARDGLRAVALRLGQEALRDARALAARVGDDLHAVASALEHVERPARGRVLDGLGPAVGEEDDAAAVLRPRPASPPTGPLREALAREARQRALRRDAEVLARELARDRHAGGGVDERRERPGRQPRDARRLGKEPVAQPRALSRAKRRKVLALQARHVDVARALGLAGLALEAEVKRAVDFRGRDRVVAELAGEREAQNVRAPARGVLLVARRHVRRAHRAARCLAALSDAIAQLDRAGVAAEVLEAEVRARRGGPVARAEAQVRVQWRRVEDAPRVHDALRVEEALHVAEDAGHLRAPESLVERAARDAVAVLA